MRRARQTRPRTLVRTVTAALALVLVAPLVGSTTATADEPAPQARKLASQRQVALATPGDFTGYGFDQCVAPTQSAMDAWWKKSPFTAVGIYISGDSRACRTQPNLSSTWVAAQVARGWRLLPIALGPQASCQPRFPRYKDDFKISPSPTGGYATAAAQGAAEADKNAADATTYGIGAGSTIWYDLEGFNLQRHPLPRVRPGLHVRVGHPHQGARLHRRLLLQRELGHQDARRRPHPAPRPVRPAGPHLDRPLGRRGQHLHDLHPGGRLAPRRPDEAVPRRPQRDVGRRHDQHRQQLHRPRRRLPAASGGPLPRHPARLLEVPRALAVVREVHARQGAAVPAHRAGHLLRSGQRLVRRRHDRRARAWQAARKFTPSNTFEKRHWTALLAAGARTTVKRGSVDESVHRLQRALNAAGAGRFRATGVFDAKTEAAVRTYQSRLKIGVSGVATRQTWNKLQQGR